MTPAPTLQGVGTALPERTMTQEALWERYFDDYYAGNALARRIWLRSGVGRRYGAVHPIEDGVSEWGTGERMRRFVREAVPLGRQALERSLAAAGVRADELGLLVVVSCTGYATPGLDILLARELGMSEDVQRLHVGHMGCYAAVPGLATAANAVAARGEPAAVLCLELTSLHTQAPSDEIEQIVAHALFADGSGAAVLVPDGRGLQLLDVAARTDPETAALMTWDVTDHGFRMGLSPAVPAALERQARPVVEGLLRRNGLAIGDVTTWVVHPGGPRILEAVSRALELDPSLLDESRSVLHDFGNCSSATVLLILERVLERRPPAPGEPVVMMAFGPGLTLQAALLRAV
jgi:predicted naringenin-chalcone synthase